MIYVLNSNNKPLMPTRNHAKVRCLLKQNKAIVIRKMPFTIKLCYDTSNYTQPISLGVDAGSCHIGISATTNNQVLFEADIQLRLDIPKLLQGKRDLRKHRRYRKTRYRKARFSNRSFPKTWMPPSVYHKLMVHVNIIRHMHSILPISKIVVENGRFTRQKTHILPRGSSVNSIHSYVLQRDGYLCQLCHGASGVKKLHVHHIESRRTGGNSPNNLITLCEKCHSDLHHGVTKANFQRGENLRDAVFMNLIRYSLLDKLRAVYSNVIETFGYITKETRELYGLKKEHYIDARCISGNPQAISDGILYRYKKIRRHNRKLHKEKPARTGIRKRQQTSYNLFGFRLFDVVKYKGQFGIVVGRRSSGQFMVHTFDRAIITNSVTYKKLKLIRQSHGFIIMQTVI